MMACGRDEAEVGVPLFPTVVSREQSSGGVKRGIRKTHMSYVESCRISEMEMTSMTFRVCVTVSHRSLNLCD